MTLLRVNGARFFQQERRVKGRIYGPYWYCKTGWGKTLHLGTKLPATVATAQRAQEQAQALRQSIQSYVSLLSRFERGDALNSGEYERLAALGISIPDDLLSLTRTTHPDLCLAHTTGETQTPLKQRLAESASETERTALAQLGLI